MRVILLLLAVVVQNGSGELCGYWDLTDIGPLRCRTNGLEGPFLSRRFLSGDKPKNSKLHKISQLKRLRQKKNEETEELYIKPHKLPFYYGDDEYDTSSEEVLNEKQIRRTKELIKDSDKTLLKELIKDSDKNPLKDFIKNSDKTPLRELIIDSNKTLLKELIKHSDKTLLRALIKDYDGSDKTLLKEIINESDKTPHHGLIRDSHKTPLKELIQDSDKTLLRALIKDSDKTPLKELIQDSHKALLKELIKASDKTPLKQLIEDSDKTLLKEFIKDSDKTLLKEPISMDIKTLLKANEKSNLKARDMDYMGPLKRDDEIEDFSDDDDAEITKILANLGPELVKENLSENDHEGNKFVNLGVIYNEWIIQNPGDEHKKYGHRKVGPGKGGEKPWIRTSSYKELKSVGDGEDIRL